MNLYLAIDAGIVALAALGLLRIASGPVIDRIHNHRTSKGER